MQQLLAPQHSALALRSQHLLIGRNWATTLSASTHRHLKWIRRTAMCGSGTRRRFRRVQPVVANGRLFIGSADGVFYFADAGTGAPLWHFAVNSPIRHSAAIWQDVVIFSDRQGIPMGCT
ncbi:MAG: hypothetical protein R2856_26550 [Caldilineaceae bacterium]